MTEIAISSILDIDSALASLAAEGIWAIRSLCDADNSRCEIFQISCVCAIGNVLDIDSSGSAAYFNCLRATRSWLDVDDSVFGFTPNNVIAIWGEICFIPIANTIQLNAQGAIRGESNCDKSNSSITLNQCSAIKFSADIDKSNGLLKHLYLKNPPLPPEIGKGIEVRGSRIPQLNKGKLIIDNTYTLDAIINGARLDGLHFVFTVKDYRSNSILLQKSTANISDNLQETSTGKGDVMLSSATPVVSGRLGSIQELLASIIIKPEDFMLIKTPSQLAYEFWAYDLMGSNTLLDAGTFSLLSL
ncbi:MAG: hypothetical protein HC836_49280 [Richelia sp. RM2_1_2]|nr:hypothetical protein [Richelia sp. RM1_1_1]NJO65787.1 hypothetical protein [Richelia sp. RM2_1_2]